LKNKSTGTTDPIFHNPASKGASVEMKIPITAAQQAILNDLRHNPFLKQQSWCAF